MTTGPEHNGDRTRSIVIGAGIFVGAASSLYFFSNRVEILKLQGFRQLKNYAPPPINGRDSGGDGSGGNGSSNGYDGEGSNDTYEMVSNATPFVAVALLIIAAAVLWPRQNSGGSTQAA